MVNDCQRGQGVHSLVLIKCYGFSNSCRERGWVVIVDARSCPYRLVKPTVSTIRAALGNIRYLFIVRTDAFWEKQRVDCRKSEVDNQVVTFTRFFLIVSALRSVFTLYMYKKMSIHLQGERGFNPAHFQQGFGVYLGFPVIFT